MTNFDNLGKTMRFGEQDPAISQAALEGAGIPALRQAELGISEDFRARYMIDAPSGRVLLPIAFDPPGLV